MMPVWVASKLAYSWSMSARQALGLWLPVFPPDFFRQVAVTAAVQVSDTFLDEARGLGVVELWIAFKLCIFDGLQTALDQTKENQ